MTRVIKVGGRPQADASLPGRVARSWAVDPRTVLVHGGGDEVTTLQGALGITARFVDGRRVTTAADLDVVRMALSGSANKRLVGLLTAAGVRALGLSGEDGALVDAAPCDPETMGFVGVPSSVNVALLELLLGGGYLPVVSPVSRSTDAALGPVLNVNGDDAAAAIAVALEADDLLLVSDVPGVMASGAVVGHLTPDEARRLVADGTAAGGMRAKLDAALTAIDGGVRRVRISDLDAIDDPARGTTVSLNGGTA